MKKILLATLEFPPTIGGIASYVHECAESLDPGKVVVYAPKNLTSTVFDEKQKYKVIRKKQLTSPFFWPRWIKTIFHFLSIIKKEKIELILVNHVLPLGYAAWIAKKTKHTPYIIISHGTDVLYALANPWKKKMMSMVVRDAEQIIFNSVSIMRRFLERMPEYEKKCSVMYPCPHRSFLEQVHEDKVEELRRSLALEGKKVILSVSRIDKGKGFLHLVAAMQKILVQEPHTVWVIVGDGPKRAEVIQEIQKRSLQNVVRFIGAIPHEQLSVYYHLADLFVLLTHTSGEREEGLGLVFLEAASAGLPIVAGKTGGVEEAVIDGVTGRVFDVYHSGDKIIETIVELLHNPEIRKKMGEAGRERIISTFQWDKQIHILDPWIGLN